MPNNVVLRMEEDDTYVCRRVNSDDHLALDSDFDFVQQNAAYE